MENIGENLLMILKSQDNAIKIGTTVHEERIYDHDRLHHES
jgi:hypothetical protein